MRGNYYAIYKEAIDQCAELKDRFAVLDIWMDADVTVDNIQVFRDFDFGTIDTLKYAAVYYPRIFTRLDFVYSDEATVTIVGLGDGSLNGSLAELKVKK